MTEGKKFGFLIGGAVTAALLIALAFMCAERVPVGHRSVATLFGKVKGTYEPGLHWPVNPLYSFEDFDVREKTLKENIGVPSQDQLTTDIDFSFQWHVDPSMVGHILETTGTAEQVIKVHLIPKARSVAREQGKTVLKSEAFFLETTQASLQRDVLETCREFLAPKGIILDDVLIRGIELPGFIVTAIEEKKVREQEAQKQEAELLRYEIEQKQIVAKATSEAEAAEKDAEKQRTLADAQAYEIEKINEAIADSPAYVQLQALKTLAEISMNPSTKIYFLDGSSPSPLPLMHLGEKQ